MIPPSLAAELRAAIGAVRDRATQMRVGVVTATSPLSVQVAGSSTAYTNVRCIAGSAVDVGATVLVLQALGQLVILGTLSSSAAPHAGVGTLLEWSGSTPPNGHKLTDGTRYTATEFPEAYAFAGVQVAASNPLWTQRTSDQTFTVPNLSNRFTLAPGTRSIGQTGGAETHTLTTAEMPAHTHGPFAVATRTTGAGADQTGTGAPPHNSTPSGTQGMNTTTSSTGGGGAHNNMPPFVVIPKLVRLVP